MNPGPFCAKYVGATKLTRYERVRDPSAFDQASSHRYCSA